MVSSCKTETCYTRCSSILPEAVGSETDSDSYFRGLPDAVVSIGAITVVIENFQNYHEITQAFKTAITLVIFGIF